jgi:hypothetical protein
MWSEQEMLALKFNIQTPHPIRMEISMAFVVVHRIVMAK